MPRSRWQMQVYFWCPRSHSLVSATSTTTTWASARLSPSCGVNRKTRDWLWSIWARGLLWSCSSWMCAFMGICKLYKYIIFWQSDQHWLISIFNCASWWVFLLSGRLFLCFPHASSVKIQSHSITMETTVVVFVVQSEINLPCIALSAKDVSDCILY